MSPPTAGTQIVASNSHCVSSTMKRLRGEISSHRFRTVTSSTNAIAARDASAPATMPRTAIDTIRVTALTPGRIGASSRPILLTVHDRYLRQSSNSTAASAGQQIVSRSPIS